MQISCLVGLSVSVGETSDVWEALALLGRLVLDSLPCRNFIDLRSERRLDLALEEFLPVQSFEKRMVHDFFVPVTSESSKRLFY